MYRIIAGKRYDTNAADFIASVSVSDQEAANKATESLYKKKTGEYFLHGVGGPLSRWGHSTRQGWTDGESIRPLTVEQAQQWLESHNMGETNAY